MKKLVLLLALFGWMAIPTDPTFADKTKNTINTKAKKPFTLFKTKRARADFKGCLTWYDGCNSCYDRGKGSVQCTERECLIYKKAYCTSWAPGYGPNAKKIPAATAPKKHTSITTPRKVTEVCPVGCEGWYDGCNTCRCGKGQTTSCTERKCLVKSKAYCASWATGYGPHRQKAPAVIAPKKHPAVPAPKKVAPHCAQPCQSWYDGCNRCTRRKGGMTLCTERYCFVKGKPYCIRWTPGCGPNAKKIPAPPAPRKVTEACPVGCESWYDGCNSCGCGKGRILGCTERYCFVKSKTYCMRWAPGYGPHGKKAPAPPPPR
ncbi:MAG: hypothetical protein H6727_05050 [Myxococcales bacterium]|nr:hypothetical protein [Myxococcales bacterium]